MMESVKYELRFSKLAAKNIKKLDRVTQERIKKSLLQLSESPFDFTKQDIKKLAGYTNSYRLRVGKYRILYTIMEHEIVIFVFNVDSRGDIYK
ncbi:type II toxin-antitoxin system RelE/ParE family toxin [Ureibacillus thermophilus]|uniref:Type II toxin-antitoxin system RelE/ParE family toxin n=1 Tax=Ureibacillus thermophilus TaxID=367743 RepID=A0A4P6UWY8_9BACL|nr:type II toxin-antitoxin system RelE/ParE family toxin [Ureibacillus thermophilus]